MASVLLGPAGREYHFEDSEFSFFVSGISTTDKGVAAAAAVGSAVSYDTGATLTVKLAADGDEIVGRLEACELRAQDGVVMGTVSLRFIGNLPLKAGETPAIGAQIIGGGITAGVGTVKTRTAIANTGSGNLPIQGSAKPSHVYSYDGTANTVNVAFGI